MENIICIIIIYERIQIVQRKIVLYFLKWKYNTAEKLAINEISFTDLLCLDEFINTKTASEQ